MAPSTHIINGEIWLSGDDEILRPISKSAARIECAQLRGEELTEASIARLHVLHDALTAIRSGGAGDRRGAA